MAQCLSTRSKCLVFRIDDWTGGDVIGSSAARVEGQKTGPAGHGKVARIVEPPKAGRLRPPLAPERQAADPARLLYESIPSAVLVLGRGGHIVHANSAAQGILGHPLNAMRGHRPDELWAAVGEDGNVLGAAGRPESIAARTKRPIDGRRLSIRRADGDWRWIQCDAVPVLGADGEPYQVVCSFFDITDRRSAEEALRESENGLRSVLDGAGIGIVRVDLEGRISAANPSFCRLLGSQAGELAGRVFDELIQPEDRPGLAVTGLPDADLAAMQAEVRLIQADGRQVWVRLITSLVRGPDGRPAFVINTVEDISGQVARQDALQQQTLHDSLTGLPNRTLLHDRVSQAIKTARRLKSGVALLLMDLDHFKDVNDTFGHQCGDQLLRQVSERLVGQLRESDTVARLGGDEFAIVLPGVENRQGAADAANKLLEALDAPLDVGGERLHVGASIGVALFPEHGEDIDTLLRRADVAMYSAKRSGARCTLYEQDQDTNSPARLTLMSEMRHALAEDQFVLYYQPKVDLSDGKVLGVEALVRWQHPELGLLMPDEFLPLAAKTGLVRALGYWVLEAAVRQSAAWKQDGLPLPIAVNLSVESLHDRELPDRVAEILASHGVEPALLQVEITESTLMADPELAVEISNRLSDMGVQLSIDDFGTGYSSLAYVRRLRAHEIKIDRSFVVDMARVENDAVIVQSTIDLGRDLGLRVVAEGVEDKKTWDLLQAGGCEQAQGFLVSRPVPAAEIGRRFGAALAAGGAGLPAPEGDNRPVAGPGPRRPAFSFDEVNRRLAILEPTALFFSLPDTVLRRLARQMTVRYVLAGQPIADSGQADSLYVIEEGICEMSLDGGDGGGALPLLTLSAGDVIGAESMVLGESGPASTRAVTDCKLLALSRPALTRLIPNDSDFLENLRQVVSQRQGWVSAMASRGRSTRGKSTAISVYSPKGGAGKTTTALHLAAELGRRHPGEVLLMDLALPFNHAALVAGLVPTTCLARVAQAAGETFEPLLWSAVLQHEAGFMVLPTALRPEEADLVGPELVLRAYQALRPYFPYVVFDLPVSLTDIVLAAFDISEHVVTVVSPELSAVHDTAKVLDILTTVLHLPMGRSHVVLNHRSADSAVEVKNVEKALSRRVTAEFKYQGSKLEQSALSGRTGVAAGARGSFAESIARLVSALEPPAPQAGVNRRVSTSPVLT